MSRLALPCLGLLVAGAVAQAGEREASCQALAIVDTADPDSPDSPRLGSWPLRPGETLAYAYVHTAEGLPAEELLALGPDGELHLVGSRSPQHGAGHVPDTPLRTSSERPGWQEARTPPGPALTPFAMFTGVRQMGDLRLLWRGHAIALAELRARSHVEWRVESRCR